MKNMDYKTLSIPSYKLFVKETHFLNHNCSVVKYILCIQTVSRFTPGNSKLKGSEMEGNVKDLSLMNCCQSQQTRQTQMKYQFDRLRLMLSQHYSWSSSSGVQDVLGMQKSRSSILIFSMKGFQMEVAQSSKQQKTNKTKTKNKIKQNRQPENQG